METETIDKLFLELSQVTRARTAMEIVLLGACKQALHHLKDATPKDRNGPCIKAISILRTALDSDAVRD